MELYIYVARILKINIFLFLQNSIGSNLTSVDIKGQCDILLFQMALVIKISIFLLIISRIGSTLLYSFQKCNQSTGNERFNFANSSGN